MDWVVYLFGSGAVFFIGIGLILAAAAVFALRPRQWVKVVITLLAVVGLLLIAASATPLPYWLYAVAGGVTLLWLVAERTNWARLSARRPWLRGAAAALWVVTAAVELPYHLTPTVAATGRPKFYVIGDSVAAGLKDREETWPYLLARSHSIEVADFSHVGATAASAMRQAEKLPADGGMVLLEIGGNDLLGSTSAAEFGRDLDRLLDRVCRPGRTVLMFELPLPPLCNEFGAAQRRLAKRYGVVLIPKRLFVAVLAGAGATVDSVHLAREGHERMAETVWAVIRPAYGG
ncbi:MAG TPA: GDSL-type esterase/lipase family protein [Gemmataceae bacterium]